MKSKTSGRLHIVLKRMAYVCLFVGVFFSVAGVIHAIIKSIDSDFSISLYALFTSIVFFYVLLGFAKIVEAAEKYLKQ